MRLNKYLSESGAWSRREADALIAEGRVTVNGRPAGIGQQMNDGDDVRVDGDAVGAARKKERPVYIALNKPPGVICTTERGVEGNIVDFVDHPERVFPIGRLDRESEGLILLTNDGDIVNQVLRVENAHEKEYLVAVDRQVTEDFVQRMARGIRLHPEGMTRPCKVAKLGARAFRIVLTQGLNRQIRRMCEECGYEVLALQRVRIMHIQLGSLKIGRWRNLTQAEIEGLQPRPGAPRAPVPPSAPAPPRDDRPRRPGGPPRRPGGAPARAGRPHGGGPKGGKRSRPGGGGRHRR